MEWSFEGAGYEQPQIAFSSKFCCLIIDHINNFMRHVFQVNSRSEIKKRNSVVSEQLSFYPFIQGMMDTKADPFNLKSWLRPFKEWFRVGRERD